MPISKEIADDKIGDPEVGQVAVFVDEYGGAEAFDGEFIPVDSRRYRCDGEVVISEHQALRGKFTLIADPEHISAENVICFLDGIWYSIKEPELYEKLGLNIVDVAQIECHPDRHAESGPLSAIVMVDEDDLLEEVIAESREEIGAARDDLKESFKTRIVMWCIRWLLGFAGIWLVTWWTGRLEWLWVAGGILAAVSLAFLVGVFVLTSRKASKVQSRLEGLKDSDFDA